jgi:hypothetical protein
VLHWTGAPQYRAVSIAGRSACAHNGQRQDLAVSPSIVTGSQEKQLRDGSAGTGNCGGTAPPNDARSENPERVFGADLGTILWATRGAVVGATFFLAFAGAGLGMSLWRSHMPQTAPRVVPPRSAAIALAL